MAATITVKLSEAYTSRSGTLTVKEALEWLEGHTGEEDEETGETAGGMTPGEAICYAVRRMQALGKDTKRAKQGKVARVYIPRVLTALAPKMRKAYVPVIDLRAASAPKTVKAPKVKKARALKAAKVDAGGADVTL